VERITGLTLSELSHRQSICIAHVHEGLPRLISCENMVRLIMRLLCNKSSAIFVHLSFSCIYLFTNRTDTAKWKFASFLIVSLSTEIRLVMKHRLHRNWTVSVKERTSIFKIANWHLQLSFLLLSCKETVKNTSFYACEIVAVYTKTIAKAERTQ